MSNTLIRGMKISKEDREIADMFGEFHESFNLYEFDLTTSKKIKSEIIYYLKHKLIIEEDK